MISGDRGVEVFPEPLDGVVIGRIWGQVVKDDSPAEGLQRLLDLAGLIAFRGALARMPGLVGTLFDLRD